jgi:site-specific DNA recombinase
MSRKQDVITPKAVKAYVLARVSSKDQEENNSIPAQERALREYCHHKGLEIIEVVRLVESSTKDRIVFNQIVDQIRMSKEPVCLVVETVDRLQRSFKESIILEELRKQGKLVLHFRRESLILDKECNSSDLLRWDVAVMFARSYVLQLSDNVKRGNKEKFEKGELAGKAPFGYSNGLNAKDRPWVYVDENKREFITWLFEAYASDNWSFTMLAEQAVKRGYMETTRQDRYRTSSIAQIMNNPFYCGILRRNGRETNHPYECIISQDLFYKVQDLIELRSRKRQKNNSIPFIFNHVFRCAKCDGAIVGCNPKKEFNYYRCSNAKCPNFKFNKSEKELLSQTSLMLSQGHLPQEIIDQVVETLKCSVEAKNKLQTETINQLSKEKKVILNRLDQMYLDKLDGCITKQQYDNIQEKQNRKLKDIDVELSKLTSSQENFYLTAESVLNLVSKAKELFELATTSEKQNILKLISYNSKADAQEYSLNLKEPFVTLFNFQERPLWQG